MRLLKTKMTRKFYRHNIFVYDSNIKSFAIELRASLAVEAIRFTPIKKFIMP